MADEADKGKDSPTINLDRGEVLKRLGTKSNYHDLPDTVQLDRGKVMEMIEKERKEALQREEAAKKLTKK